MTATTTIRVRGESYRTPGEARQAARELRAAESQTPEYGPQRRQLRQHAQELEQAAADREKGQSAKDLHGPLVSPKLERKWRVDAADAAAAGRPRRAASPSRAERVVRDVGGRLVDTATEPAAGMGELAFEAAGLTLASIAFYLLLRNPTIVPTGTKGALGALGRAVDLVDPLTGRRATTAAPPPAHRTPAPTASWGF